MVTVLVDATALPAERGGVGRYVDELVTRLPGLGIEVHVVAQPRDEERFAAVVGATRVRRASPWATSVPARLAWEQVGLPLVVHAVKPDVVHSPHYTMPLAVDLHGRAGQVVTLHDATFFSIPDVHVPGKRRFFETWSRLSASRADALVVPSVATRDEVLTHTSARPDHLHVVPHGVDHDVFRPPSAQDVAAVRAHLGVPEGRDWVAFLGTLEPRKNVPALVEAWVAACRDRTDPPVLVLAGGRGWDTRLDAAVAAVPDGLTVLRPGFVPDALVPALLGGATVVAYPALGEGFGLPVLEAMACGAPVLTTRLLSLPEVGGDAVAYAETPAAGDIAVALARLLDDEALRADLSARGVARAAGFTWERAAAGHLAVYEAAAHRGR